MCVWVSAGRGGKIHETRLPSCPRSQNCNRRLQNKPATNKCSNALTQKKMQTRMYICTLRLVSKSGTKHLWEMGRLAKKKATVANSFSEVSIRKSGNMWLLYLSILRSVGWSCLLFYRLDINRWGLRAEICMEWYYFDYDFQISRLRSLGLL